MVRAVQVLEGELDKEVDKVFISCNTNIITNVTN